MLGISAAYMPYSVWVMPVTFVYCAETAKDSAIVTTECE